MQRVSKNIKLLRNEYLLFRNADYIAVNKPVGVETFSGKEAGAALRKLLESMELIDGSVCPVPINSMKANVSGIQLMSVHGSAGKLARSMVKSGHFWRCKYWGIVSGRAIGRPTSGIVNIPLVNGVPSTDGEPSITHWKRLKYTDQRDCLSLMEFEPRTDVADQIGIHCELSLKTPLLPGNSLHLYGIAACLPGGEDVEIVAPPRGEFKETMQSLGWT